MRGRRRRRSGDDFGCSLTSARASGQVYLAYIVSNSASAATEAPHKPDSADPKPHHPLPDARHLALYPEEITIVEHAKFEVERTTRATRKELERESQRKLERESGRQRQIIMSNSESAFRHELRCHQKAAEDAQKDRSAPITPKTTTVAMAASRPSDEMSILREFDQALVDTLKDGAIRLLDAELLRRIDLSDPNDLCQLKHMLSRQDLEANFSTALLDPTAAADILKDPSLCRCIAFLTYGWRSKHGPDPDGITFATVVRALKDPLCSHIKGIFWDYPCMYQYPRTDEQEKLFRQGLSMMAFGYASPLGTAVLRLRDIPSPPSWMESLIYTYDLHAAVHASLALEGSPGKPLKIVLNLSIGTSTDYVTSAFAARGRDVLECTLEEQVNEPPRFRVRLGSAGQALSAVEDVKAGRVLAVGGVPAVAMMAYNNRSYADRGCKCLYFKRSRCAPKCAHAFRSLAWSVTAAKV